jgi:hypothetical protein
MSQVLKKPPQWIYSFKKKTTNFAVFWAILFMPSSCNRVMLYMNSAGYHPVSFTVIDGTYDSSSDSLASYSLIGTVEGHKEHLIPPLKSESGVNSSEELLKVFPKGTKLPAMYNPSIPGIFFQGESLRLRYDNGKFWENEVKGGSSLLKLALLPLLPALILKIVFRFRKYPESYEAEN